MVNKNRFVGLLLAVSSCFSVCAQSLKFEVRYKGELLENEQIIEIRTYETNIDGEMLMLFDPEVKNSSSTAYGMRIGKEEVELQPGTSNSLCWDTCVEPYDQFATSANINPEETQHPYADFYLNADGEAQKGTSIVYYTFQTNKKGDKGLKVKVHYIYEGALSSVRNDALTPIRIGTQGGLLRIETTEALTLPLYTIDGILVRMLSFVPGVNVVSDLPKGVYLLGKHRIIL